MDEIHLGTMKENKELIKIVKGSGITFIGDILGKGINFISQIVIARLLGVNLFGSYALGFIILNVAKDISQIGLPQGALRYISIYNGAGDKGRIKGTIIQSLSFPFIIGSVVGIAIFFNSENIASLFNKPELTSIIRVISFGVPFTVTMMVSIFASRGFQKMQYFVYVKNIFHPIVNLALVILLYRLGFYLLGAFYAWIIAAGLALLLSIYFLKKEFPDFFDAKAIYNTKELIKFSIPLALVGILNMLFMRTDILMLGYFKSSADVGIYRVVTQIVLLSIIGSSAFGSVFSPMFADLYNKGKIGKLNSLLKIIAKWTFFISLPVFIMIILCSKELLIIFGSQFTRGVPSLLVLVSFYLVSVSTGPIGSLLPMAGRQNIALYNTLGVFILNIVLNLLFIPKFGIIGAALSTGISIATLHFITLFQLFFLLNLWPYSGRYYKGLVAGAGAGVITFVFRLTISRCNYIVSLLVVAISISIIFVSILLILELDEEDRRILKSMKRKILQFLQHEHHNESQ